MTNIKTKRICIKAMLLLLVTCALLGGFLWRAPTPASAASAFSSNVYLDWREALTDPVAVNTDKGVYYVPTAYVYLGEVYDAATGYYVPLLHRVLDADADNLGNGGAMLLMSQSTMFSYYFTMQNDEYCSIVQNENDYTDSRLTNDWMNGMEDLFIHHMNNSNYTYVDELDYIRSVTKSDDQAAMDGLYELREADGGYYWEVVSNPILNDQAVFALSVEELARYVGDYSGADGMVAKNAVTGALEGWWLRTAVSDYDGNLVAYVTADGRVRYQSVQNTAALRPAFNFETDDIAFVVGLGDNTYRLAMHEPTYKNTSSPFSASLTDVRNGVVSLRVWNYIARCIDYDDESEFFSYIILDKDGNEKYYDVIRSVGSYGSKDEILGRDDALDLTLTLPECYEEGDSIKVFWERKGSDNNTHMSFVSNMVDLGCIHRADEEKPAYCRGSATCALCGEEFGYFDLSVHLNLEEGYVIDTEKNTHSLRCSDCGELAHTYHCSFNGSIAPKVCTDRCICGNFEDSPALHSYDSDGICRRDRDHIHYQMPVINPWGNFGAQINIENVGQWNALANYLNAGGYSFFDDEWIVVNLTVDLDFTDLEFIPIGTEAKPIENIDIKGGRHTISGITLSDEGRTGLGLIGVAEKATVESLYLKNCTFAGASHVGAVIGRGTELGERALWQVFVIDCTVDAADGSAGALVGDSNAVGAISTCIVYRVQSSDGAHLDFSGDGDLLVDVDSSKSGSFRLADVSDGGAAITAGEFASGMIAWRWSQFYGGWRQLIGTDAYPVYTPNSETGRVYRVTTCDGSSVTYLNENVGQLQHGSYTAYHGEVTWNDNGLYGVGATISVTCGTCGNVITADCEIEEAFYSNGTFIVKSQFTPYVMINGEKQVVGEAKTIISTRMEDLIGMTNMVKDYDGRGVAPDELMNNHRLISSPPGMKEYEAFFLDPVTGERFVAEYYDYYGKLTYIPAGVKDVGVYDLLIVGRKLFEGQECLYKGALTINKVTVTVTPSDVHKYHDGNADFEAHYTVDNENFDDEEFIALSFASAGSAAPGKYALRVVADLNSHRYGSNITVVLARDTVTGMILPNVFLEIENKSYPTDFTYGDVIPTPTAAHFGLSAPAALTFTWYKTELNDWNDAPVYLKKMDSAPVDAGEYILRVSGVCADGSMVSATLDIPIDIHQKMLELEIIPPAGVKTEERDGELYYIIDHDDQFSYRVNGFVNGETLESTGMRVSVYLWPADSWYKVSGDRDRPPYMPSEGDYQVAYHIELYDNYNRAYNYTRDGGVYIYVDMNAPAYTYPIDTTHVADDSSKGVNLLVAGPSGLITNGKEFDYTMVVKDADGREIARKSGSGIEAADIFGYFGEDGEFATPGTYTATVTVEGEGASGSYSFDFTVLYQNENGDWVYDLSEMGRYQALVYMGEVTAEQVDASGDTLTAQRACVRLQRRVFMDLKPVDFNLTDDKLTYDPKMVIMEAGASILLGHTLADVSFEVMTNGYGRAWISAIKVVDAAGNDVSDLYYLDRTRNTGHDGSVNVAHIYDDPCDPDCNICDKPRAVAHSGGLANCSERAICSICGAYYGELVADRHIATTTRILPNIDDVENSHLVVYTCCGGTKSVVEHTPATPATCISLAVCSECGWSYGELDPNNHATNERTYATNGESGHTTTYVCCGATAIERHVGGTAYCNAQAVCTLCNGAYGALNPRNHAQQSVFRPDPNDRQRHNEIYDCCGHSESFTHEGGDATCIAFAVCTVCGGEYGELQPDDHASDGYRYVPHAENPSLHNVHHACCNVYIGKEYHTGGVANCQSPAICEGCGNTYGDIDASVHATEECRYYQNPDNADRHVKVMACCGHVLGTEAHAFGNATCTHAARCACGAERGEAAAHVFDNDCDAVCNTCGEQARAEIFHLGDPGDPCEICGTLIEDEPISGGAISGIVTGSTVVAGAGGLSLFWFVIKKKSWKALVKLIIG